MCFIYFIFIFICFALQLFISTRAAINLTYKVYEALSEEGGTYAGEGGTGGTGEGGTGEIGGGGTGGTGGHE